jgi:hypothetical protein
VKRMSICSLVTVVLTTFLWTHFYVYYNCANCYLSAEDFRSYVFVRLQHEQHIKWAVRYICSSHNLPRGCPHSYEAARNVPSYPFAQFKRFQARALSVPSLSCMPMLSTNVCIPFALRNIHVSGH